MEKFHVYDFELISDLQAATSTAQAVQTGATDAVVSGGAGSSR